MFDFGDTLIPQPLFEKCLTPDHFDGTSLMLRHYIWCRNENGGLVIIAIPSWQTSRRLTDELVCRDKVTNFVLVTCDSSLTILKWLSM